MPASNDSKKKSRPNLLGNSKWLLWALLLLAIPGCGRSERDASLPEVLHGIDSEIIARHGQLCFVQDLTLGRRLAAEKGLPCLLFFTAEWCTYCHQMAETSFADGSVAKMAENFVCVLVDADRDPDVCRRFSVTGFPTIQFVSANGRELNRLVGRQSVPHLLTGMRAAMKRFAWLNDPDARVR